jgi:hypothetical protein
VPDSEIEGDDTQNNEVNDAAMINGDRVISDNNDKEMGVINSNGTK